MLAAVIHQMYWHVTNALRHLLLLALPLYLLVVAVNNRRAPLHKTLLRGEYTSFKPMIIGGQVSIHSLRKSTISTGTPKGSVFEKEVFPLTFKEK